MISRIRLHEANRHARRRFRLLRWGDGYMWYFRSVLPDTRWQQFRKTTTKSSIRPKRRYEGLTVQERRQLQVE